MRISTIHIKNICFGPDYYAPVCSNSCHVNIVESQPNNIMRLVSDTIRPTPTYRLPSLCNILPSHIQRNRAVLNKYEKFLDNNELPIPYDISDLDRRCLRSRNPPLRFFQESNFNSRKPMASRMRLTTKWLPIYKAIWISMCTTLSEYSDKAEHSSYSA